MHLGGIKALLRHECLGAMRRALALAADTEQIAVVAHDMGDIDRRLLMRESREAYLAAAIDHAERLVDGVRRARAFDHVIDALIVVERAHSRDRIFLARIDDMIRAE